jgi:hypothetical protein
VNDAPQAHDAPQEQARLSDLFASAVHRFGTVWADLLVASLVFVGLASVPVAAVHFTGGTPAATGITTVFAYGIGYQVFLAFVMLRGLPEPASRRRVTWSYSTAVLIGALTGVLELVPVLQEFTIALLPLFLFAVPGIAAGDVSPAAVLPYSFGLAIRNFTRTWAVWLITLVFSTPVVISMFLAVTAFASGARAVLLALLFSVPVVWPFSALFIRALYGDLTGRLVVAPQDRTR